MDLSLITFGVILPPNPPSKNLTNSQINPGTSDENENSKVRTINLLLESGAGATIVCKDVLYERHRILKDKTTFVAEIILKLLQSNHSIINLREMPFDQ